MAFVVGIMIGTGIYVQPQAVAERAPEAWQNLLLWAAGGVFALSGAVVYARLSAAWPQSGGAFVYLRNCYGEWVASLLLAADVLLGRPAAVGALATGLGLIWELEANATLLVAAATLLSLTAGQLFGRKATGGIQVVLTVMQMLPLVLVGMAGANLPAAPATPPVPGEPVLWASGFLAVMWAYDGWYNITILGGEVEKPEVNLRRSLIGGVLIVTIVYVALNALLLSRVPRADIVKTVLPFAALLSGWGLSSLGVVLKASLSLALLATLNGILACGPSMLAASGLGGSELASVRRSTLLFSAWCLGLLLLFAGLPSQFALFNQLTDYTSVIVAALSGLTVTCLFHLRRFGQKADPISMLAALIFLSIDLALMIRLAGERPGLALGGSASVLLAGSVLHYVRGRQAWEPGTVPGRLRAAEKKAP